MDVVCITGRWGMTVTNWIIIFLLHPIQKHNWPICYHFDNWDLILFILLRSKICQKWELCVFVILIKALSWRHTTTKTSNMYWQWWHCQLLSLEVFWNIFSCLRLNQITTSMTLFLNFYVEGSSSSKSADYGTECGLQMRCQCHAKCARNKGALHSYTVPGYPQWKVTMLES